MGASELKFFRDEGRLLMRAYFDGDDLASWFQALGPDGWYPSSTISPRALELTREQAQELAGDADLDGGELP